MERMATQGLGSKKIAAALGVPVSTTKRWLQRLRSDGDMASRNIGRPRGAEVGVYRVFFAFFLHISRLRVICAFCQGVHGCNEERVRAQGSSMPGFLLTRAAQSSVFANVCRRVASSAAAAASRITCRVEIVFCCIIFTFPREPKRLWDLSRKTHISRGFEVIVLLVPSRTSDSGSFGYLVLSVTHLPANSLDGHHVLVVALMFAADHPCPTTRTRLGACLSRNLWRVHSIATNHSQAFS